MHATLRAAVIAIITTIACDTPTAVNDPTAPPWANFEEHGRGDEVRLRADQLHDGNRSADQGRLERQAGQPEARSNRRAGRDPEKKRSGSWGRPSRDDVEQQPATGDE